jgi:hypothetical protein
MKLSNFSLHLILSFFFFFFFLSYPDFRHINYFPISPGYDISFLPGTKWIEMSNS